MRKLAGIAVLCWAGLAGAGSPYLGTPSLPGTKVDAHAATTPANQTVTAAEYNNQNTAIADIRAALQSGTVYDVRSVQFSGGADPTGATDSTAAIQAAITAAPAHGTIFLPNGTYKLSGTLPLAVDSSKNLMGAGWGVTLLVPASVSSSTDVINVTPSEGSVLSNFTIIPVSGTPARHGIHLDGTSGVVNSVVIDHVYVGQLGASAIGADGSGSSQGTPVLTTIQNCILNGGITLSNAGDTVRVLNNQIAGAGYAIDAEFQAGAASLIVKGNNITSLGGLHIGASGVATQIVGNEFEASTGFTGSNSSVVDIDGTAGNPISDVIIRDNSISVISPIVANGVRINYAARTIIEGNRLFRGATGSKDILTTANASNTLIGTNDWASFGAMSLRIADASASTVLATRHIPSAGVQGSYLTGNDVPLASVDETGAVQPIAFIGVDGTVTLSGYHGATAVVGVNGATHIYDSAGNIGVTVSSTGSLLHKGGIVEKVNASSGAGTTYVASAHDRYILMTDDATRTASVPGASAAGQMFTFVDASGSVNAAHTITVSAASGSINSGSGATAILTPGTSSSLTLVSDGANYWIVDKL
jgi:hypothetical protein